MGISLPIKNKAEIDTIKDLYRRKNKFSEPSMFTLAINTGIDLLNLKIKDIKNKLYLSLDKNKSIPLNDEILELIKQVIVATEPSLKKYKPIKDAIHIGVNRAFKVKDFKIGYLFMIDWRVFQDYVDELQNYDCTKFCGQHSNPDFEVLARELVSRHIPESVVHRLGVYRYYSNTFDNKIFNDISSCPLMDFGYAIFPAIHYALYTNPKRLYLVGGDCTLNGYWDRKEQKNRNEWLMDTTIKGYEKIKRFAHAYYPEIEIISINPVNLRGVFNDFDQTNEECIYAKNNN